MLEMENMNEINGGRTRTRTLDPLIKSLIFFVQAQPFSYKPRPIGAITNQLDTGKMQTGETIFDVRFTSTAEETA
jgi:hypothetical protein